LGLKNKNFFVSKMEELHLIPSTSPCYLDYDKNRRKASDNSQISKDIEN